MKVAANEEHEGMIEEDPDDLETGPNGGPDLLHFHPDSHPHSYQRPQ